MIRWRSGNKIFRSQRLPHGVSYRLDSEISAPNPKSWGAGVFAKTFSEGDEEPTGLRDCGIHHGERSYSHGDDNSPKICSV